MVRLTAIDWWIVGGFFLLSLAIGLYSSRQAGKSAASFFLSKRDMPWWLLGISMVATTFSADTPNLVTDIVRKNGIAGNWVWWAFLLTGMLTVFVYSRLWRRTGFLTDLEFYEARYSGTSARFLRTFRAFYLGVIFNVLVMATVCLAGIKIGNVLLGMSPIQTVIIASTVTVLYAFLGGLKGIILTDFFQFILAMVGTIWAAYFIVNMPEIGGLAALFEHPNVSGKLDLIPSMDNKQDYYLLFLIPLSVQWWASYYPGAEPGGGGYVAQRMLAAKNESHALSATLLFNMAHYALRPWPWILIALASLVMFPDLAAIKQNLGHVEHGIIDDDLAYSAMLTYLPSGLLGIVVASLIAAFMSTISSHLNWGASYISNDLYKTLYKPAASEKELVLVGRLATIVLMIAAMVVSLFLQNALEAFGIILLIGAGTGLIFILRWFWWRINAYSEISAMLASFVIALYLQKGYDGDMTSTDKLLVNVALTTIIWIVVTFLTPPTEAATLTQFYKRIRPYSLGWKAVIGEHDRVGESTSLGMQLLAMLLGSMMVYALLFAIGYWLFGFYPKLYLASAVAIVSAFLLKLIWNRLD